MTKGVYVAALEEHSGKSLIVLGLMDGILNYLPKVGYFKPIITVNGTQAEDPHIRLILRRFNTSVPYKDAYGFSGREVADILSNKSDIAVIDAI